MAFRRVRETLSALLASSPEGEYQTPREYVEQYLPGMDHKHHSERPQPSGLVKLFVGAFVVVPISVQIGKVVSALVQVDDTLVPTLVVGWINGYLVLQYSSAIAKVLPIHLLNPLLEPLNIFGVRRIKENAKALRGAENGQQELQTNT